MKDIIVLILIAIVAINVADYIDIYDAESTPFIGKYVDFNNYPIIGGYKSNLEGITLPRYTGDDLWGDLDGDGVINVYDCCWNEPTNWLGVYFGTGCPDSDYDTIANQWDECPNVAGVSGSLEFPLGCPPAPPVIPTTPTTPTTPTAPTTTDENTSDTNTTTIGVNSPPNAVITYEVIVNKVYVNGNMSSDSDGNVTNYLWNFGEGTTETGKTTTYDYVTTGIKTITLTVIDNEGAIGMASQNIEITKIPSTVAPDSTLTEIIKWLLFFGIIFILLILAFPKKTDKVRRKLGINKVEKGVKKMAPRTKTSNTKPIFVEGHYRAHKGESSKGGLL